MKQHYLQLFQISPIHLRCIKQLAFLCHDDVHYNVLSTYSDQTMVSTTTLFPYFCILPNSKFDDMDF